MKYFFKICALIVLSNSLFLSNAYAGIGVKAGANFGLGEMGSESDAIEARSMNYVAAYGLPYYSIMDLYVGPMFEYRKVGQNDKPSEVGNTNLRGQGYILGVAVGYSMLGFFGHLSYDFLGTYDLGNDTAGGSSSSYNTPSGFRLLAGYKILPKISIDVTYVMDKYEKNDVGGTEVDISDDQLKDTRYGIGATFHFDIFD